jgi:hypothetical protein
MKQGSFPYSQGPAPRLYPTQNKSVHTILLTSVTSTFILTFHLQCLFFLFRFSNQNSGGIFHNSHSCYILLPSHPPSFHFQIYGKQYKFKHFLLCNFFKFANYFKPLPLPPSPLLILLLLALQSLENLSLFQNCPPLFLVL